MLNRVKIIERKLLIDDRGWFIKVINGKEENLPKYTGEVYFTCAKTGSEKGGHYHLVANEWFTLIKGKAILKLVDIETSECRKIILDANTPVTVYIPSKIAHSVINNYNEEYILCAYTDKLYDPTDTIPFNLSNYD